MRPVKELIKENASIPCEVPPLELEPPRAYPIWVIALRWRWLCNQKKVRELTEYEKRELDTCIALLDREVFECGNGIDFVPNRYEPGKTFVRIRHGDVGVQL
jgi:hypothetical protein